MNIEEAIKYIKNDIECDKDTRDWFNDKNNPTRKQIEESIDAYETLLTAYEKEKEIVDKINKLNIPVDTLIAEFERLENLEDDRDMLKTMLSDEEKKAIESLKKDLDCTVITFCKAGLEDIKIVLNLIEKQSKEIEELKANKGYHLGFIDGGISKKYEMEDKIKAKIEEYEKALNILLQKDEWIEPSDTIIRNKFMHYIEFGQSLLEKE